MERDQTGPRILLVDDQVDITEVFSEILEGFGYQVMVARDGYDAVEMYFKHRPDLVLMDISLLSMDGDVATERILKKDPNAKILILTS
ncbi:MAG: response regulator, partial [Thermoprotei archaeon]